MFWGTLRDVGTLVGFDLCDPAIALSAFGCRARANHSAAAMPLHAISARHFREGSAPPLVAAGRKHALYRLYAVVFWHGWLLLTALEALRGFAALRLRHRRARPEIGRLAIYRGSTAMIAFGGWSGSACGSRGGGSRIRS